MDEVFQIGCLVGCSEFGLGSSNACRNWRYSLMVLDGGIVHSWTYSFTTAGIQYNTIQYNTIQYNTIQYNTVYRLIFYVPYVVLDDSFAQRGLDGLVVTHSAARVKKSGDQFPGHPSIFEMYFSGLYTGRQAWLALRCTVATNCDQDIKQESPA